ncbi:polysaccharide pyruvyl transferase [Sporosarcina sp. P37]|uniref:polysaccharide pyruvyl transferase family protein n=1 Tax=Sporosarcina sp. P35 TaxID=2048246 RepID=UPI0009BF9DDB|nr:polysaccharide pyruvyl transferase family protein [Sporosarcina sp. P35]ARD48983.1 polysaccharide pyruvyl transferase [Sporosarcina sp. P33]ARK25464.1 polysaccharide pyruvyl transferase [Sporosarcina sp. P37]PID18981.1 polysaccharide pyruvyl transferase [Sporosarcina sp. P35]
MKIGIVGNYGNDNNGDEAILLSIISQVTSTFNVPSDAITVFSNNPKQTAKRYQVMSAPLYYKKGNAVKTFGATYLQNKKIVKTFDLLIIGGGGILMDLYKREAPLYGSYAMMAKNSGVPYVVYGCGAGPLSSELGKWFIRYMSKHAESISVRDPESAALLKSIGVKKSVEVMADPAFSLKRERQSSADRPLKIGVTAVPYYHGGYWPESKEEIYQQYIEGMAKNLDVLAAAQPVEITFFATKFPQDADVTKDIQALMKESKQTTVIDRNLLPEDLLEVTASQDILIGTRLHSLILATCTSTPVIAVCYHHKVTDFMKLADLSHVAIPIDEMHTSDSYLADAYDSLASDWNDTCEKTAKLSDTLYEAAMKGTRQFTEAIKKSI